MECRNFNDFISNKAIRITNYWSLNDNKDYIDKIHEYKSLNSVKNTVENILFNSVKKQLISDVPVCSFLSGGIDYSLIAILLKQANPLIDTFTVGFENKYYDESKFAENIAKKINLKNNIINVSDKDIIDTVPLLPEIYSEPFADSSQIPTYLICKKIKEKATVALSGDGGDELFGCYNRYMLFNKYKFLINYIPQNIKNLTVTLMNNNLLKPISNYLLNNFLKLSGDPNINYSKIY